MDEREVVQLCLDLGENFEPSPVQLEQIDGQPYSTGQAQLEPRLQRRLMALLELLWIQCSLMDQPSCSVALLTAVRSAYSSLAAIRSARST